MYCSLSAVRPVLTGLLACPCRVEDEAVLDRGAAFVKHICDAEEVEGEITGHSFLIPPPPSVFAPFSLPLSLSLPFFFYICFPPNPASILTVSCPRHTSPIP